MNGGEVQMTQGVSQMTSHSAVNLSDELLSTKLMTIEDLIESNEVFIYESIVDIYPQYSFRKCSSVIHCMRNRLYICIIFFITWFKIVHLYIIYLDYIIHVYNY